MTHLRLMSLNQVVDRLFGDDDLRKAKTLESTREEVTALVARVGCCRMLGGRMWFTEDDTADLLHAMHEASQRTKPREPGAGWVVMMHVAVDPKHPLAVFWVGSGQSVEDRVQWFEMHCGMGLMTVEPATMDEYAKLHTQLAPSQSYGVMYKRGFGTDIAVRTFLDRKKILALNGSAEAHTHDLER